MQSSGNSDMTLAFELEALKQLAEPDTVFTNTRQWSSYVGVVSEKPTYVVTNFTRKKRIRQDFFSGPRGKQESLTNVKQQFDTNRHVFIGTTDEDEALAEETGWEYLDIEDAAEAAEWELGEPKPQTTNRSERDDWP
ncbi:DUF7124 domain-containing protein [Halocatena marina]|uniref:DUF7124 domain-containing protein n=1 Tax=Halocatena marina TaxID=2934937 RepID=A0ABD5YH73_9EURY|nr:hypothetical protein [Halocatena marina]